MSINHFKSRPARRALAAQLSAILAAASISVAAAQDASGKAERTEVEQPKRDAVAEPVAPPPAAKKAAPANPCAPKKKKKPSNPCAQ